MNGVRLGAARLEHERLERIEGVPDHAATGSGRNLRGGAESRSLAVVRLRPQALAADPENGRFVSAGRRAGAQGSRVRAR